MAWGLDKARKQLRGCSAAPALPGTRCWSRCRRAAARTPPPRRGRSPPGTTTRGCAAASRPRLLAACLRRCCYAAQRTRDARDARSRRMRSAWRCAAPRPALPRKRAAAGPGSLGARLMDASLTRSWALVLAVRRQEQGRCVAVIWAGKGLSSGWLAQFQLRWLRAMHGTCLRPQASAWPAPCRRHDLGKPPAPAQVHGRQGGDRPPGAALMRL